MVIYNAGKTKSFYDAYGSIEWDRLESELNKQPGLLGSGSHIIMAARRIGKPLGAKSRLPQ